MNFLPFLFNKNILTCLILSSPMIAPGKYMTTVAKRKILLAAVNDSKMKTFSISNKYRDK